MAFLAPITAEIGGWALRRVLPWILCALVLLMLGTALWVQTVRLKAAGMQLQADTVQLHVVGEDARRWQMASDQRDQIIREQAGQLTHLRADAATAQEVADDLETSRQHRIAELDSQLRQLKARAHAHPDQVRSLGPLAIDVLNSVHRSAAEQPDTDTTSH